MAGLIPLAGAGLLVWLVLTPGPALEAGPLVVDIPAHEGLLGIADRLADAGVVRSRAAFIALSAARGSVRRLKAGEYEVPRDASTIDVVGLLESGRVRQHTVLHPEGATLSELARVLESARLAPAEEVLRAAHDPAVLKTLGVEGPSLEGYLFPDTYQFVRGMSVEEMLGRMVQRTRSRLTAERLARAKALGLDAHGLLTLASIIEREAVDPDERRLDLGGVLEPPAPGHAAAGRSHRAVRGRQGAAHAHAQRPGDRQSLQHVRAPRAAAGPDREPGPAGHRRRRSIPRRSSTSTSSRATIADIPSRRRWASTTRRCRATGCPAAKRRRSRRVAVPHGVRMTQIPVPPRAFRSAGTLVTP